MLLAVLIIHLSLCVSACVLPPTPLSLRATVHVRVNDVNEFSPVFVERRYEASVPEGRLFDRIVRVEALDADCSPQYSQICFYDIITPNVPFAIDNDGEIFYLVAVNQRVLGLAGLLIFASLLRKYDLPTSHRIIFLLCCLHCELCVESLNSIFSSVFSS